MFGNGFNAYSGNPWAVQYQPQMQAQPQMQQQPQQMSQPNSNNNSSIIWVNGIEGAKAFLVAPNNAVQLMDTEQNVFYIKSCDNSGMPTLRIFDYSERNGNNNAKNEPKTDNAIDMSNYITREEFNAEMAKFKPKTDNKTKPKKEVEE